MLENFRQPVRLFQSGFPSGRGTRLQESRYELKLFGGFELSGHSGVVAISSKKLRGLLAYLVLSQPKSQPRETLMTLLWGSHFDKQARQNLRQGLTRLNKLLGPGVLVIDDEAVGLKPGVIDSDVGRVRRAMDERSADSLRAVSNVSSAELLAGLSIPEDSWNEWLRFEVPRQRDQLVSALVLLSVLELDLERYDAALLASEGALTIEPLREDAFRCMVQALGGLGRGSSAVARLSELQQRLADELGVGPAAETLALVSNLQGTLPATDAKDRTIVSPPIEPPDEPSLAVVPFSNITRDEQAEIIANGLAEDIVTTLAKVSNILVVARASTLTYIDTEAHWRDVSREQGVRYVLEGAVSVVGDRVRVTSHLIDAVSGRQIWADRFDRWFKNFLDIQDEITQEVVSALQVKLTDGEQARIWARGTSDTKAWENVVVATELIHAHHRDGIEKARLLAEEAVQRDPRFAAALAAVGWTHWVEGRWGWTDSEARLATASEFADEALAADPMNPDALSLRGVCLLHLGRFDEAIDAMETAMRNAPGHAHITALTAYVHRYAGKVERVASCMERAVRLSPVHPAWYSGLRGHGFWRTGQPECARDCFRQAHINDPDFVPAFAMHASMLGELGNTVEAGEIVGAMLAADSAFSSRSWCDLNPFRNPQDREREFQGLMKAGAPV